MTDNFQSFQQFPLFSTFQNNIIHFKRTKVLIFRNRKAVTIMNKAHYVNLIIELLHQCRDTDLLDLVYTLLQTENNAGLLLNEPGYQAAEIV